MTPVVFKLETLRKSAGLTQAALADAVGVRQATISDLENDKSRRIDLDLLDSLCRVLSEKLDRDIKPGDLLEREPPKRKGRG